jgi:ketopantoate reductase
MLFMLNNPAGSSGLVRALGQDRVLLGFPGAGGTRDGHTIRYAIIPQQPTTLGELSGQRTERLRKLVEAFRESGFPTKISRDMDAWLMAHAFFVTAIGGAIYLAGGNCHRLSEDSATLRLMTTGVREGFILIPLETGVSTAFSSDIACAAAMGTTVSGAGATSPVWSKRTGISVAISRTAAAGSVISLRAPS